MSQDKSAVGTISIHPMALTAARRMRACSGVRSAVADIAAVMVERDNGSCTVLWAGKWRNFSSRSELWPTRERAMQAVRAVTGEILIWRQMSPQTWIARAA
jgi:hypothetical protein